MRAAIYARVSTSDQNCDLQLSELRAYCQHRQWEIAGEYVDRGVSGTRRNRPELDRLMQDAKKHRFDVVIVWKLDRWGRSVSNSLESINVLRALKIRWISTTQNLDTDESNPMATFMLHIMAAFAELEREMIRERVMAGKKRYEADWTAGKVGVSVQSKSGRNLAAGRPLKIFDRDGARRMRAEGRSLRAIALELGVSAATVLRLVAKDRPTVLQNDSVSLPAPVVANEGLN